MSNATPALSPSCAVISFDPSTSRQVRGKQAQGKQAQDEKKYIFIALLVGGFIRELEISLRLFKELRDWADFFKNTSNNNTACMPRIPQRRYPLA